VNKRLETLLAEITAATALTILSMPPHERALYAAQALQLSARLSRRIAEACLRYAIRTEGAASRLVSP
jgi:hypothetical protein